MTEKDLAKITNKVCIMIGEQDNMVSIKESKLAEQALSNSNFVLLEGVVHPLEKNDARALAEHILKAFSTV